MENNDVAIPCWNKRRHILKRRRRRYRQGGRSSALRAQCCPLCTSPDCHCAAASSLWSNDTYHHTFITSATKTLHTNALKLKKSKDVWSISHRYERQKQKQLDPTTVWPASAAPTYQREHSIIKLTSNCPIIFQLLDNEWQFSLDLVQNGIFQLFRQVITAKITVAIVHIVAIE